MFSTPCGRTMGEPWLNKSVELHQSMTRKCLRLHAGLHASKCAWDVSRVGVSVGMTMGRAALDRKHIGTGWLQKPKRLCWNCVLELFGMQLVVSTDGYDLTPMNRKVPHHIRKHLTSSSQLMGLCHSILNSSLCPHQRGDGSKTVDYISQY